MLYGFVIINGQKLSDIWKTKPRELLTVGQIDFMMKEIQLQMNGAGLRPSNGERNNTLYNIYKMPGTPVEIEKK